MHGTTMMFLFAVPVMEAFAVYLVPLMVGTRNIAFPRLNAFSYWVYLFGGLIIWVAFVLNIGPDVGWFAYVPLSGPEYSPGKRADIWAQMITFTEVSALAVAVEIIVTVFKQRAPGMTLDRIPLFVWAMLVTSFVIVFAMPAVMLASTMLILDRLVGTQFFNPAEGGERCCGSTCSGSSGTRRSTSSSFRRPASSPPSSRPSRAGRLRLSAARAVADRDRVPVLRAVGAPHVHDRAAAARGELLHRVEHAYSAMDAKLFRQFSFPGGVPSHVAAETPGSIHEGGELGYALVHAYGAAFDNPDLVVACVIGDGEAETGPLAASWHSNKFLNPVTDGAVLPILHLNGYKIANPTVLSRIPQEELESLFYGYGYRPITVAGDDPANVHQQMATALDEAFDQIGAIQQAARLDGEIGPTAVADDHHAHPEGLDRAQRGGRQEGGGHLAVASGAAVGDAHQPRAHGAARAVAAQLPARGIVRRAGGAPARVAGAGADRAAQDERQPACQRRATAARSGPARVPRLRRRRGQTGDRNR